MVQEREDRKAHVKEMEHARNETSQMTSVTPAAPFHVRFCACVHGKYVCMRRLDLLCLAQDKNPVGKDSGKQASVGNKIMDSRKAHYGVMQSNR